MAKKALMLDFYGTIAQEDDSLVTGMCTEIASRSRLSVSSGEVGSFLWDSIYRMMLQSNGKRFINKKQIVLFALQQTARCFEATVHCDRMAQLLYRHWEKPKAFDDVAEFFARVPVPVCVVSNSDRDDLQSAVIHNRLLPDTLITSQDAKCYKPHSIIFQHALNCISLTKRDVVFVGDSIACDMVGAMQMEMDCIWMNREDKPVSSKLGSMAVCRNLLEILDLNLF